MEYHSLYRKYRPSNFSEVYGQTVAKKILINAIKQNKISHAYLFFGPRGTGKTSIAKMFARVCNCSSSINGKCCEKCDNCIESSEKNCVDIIEIDAASNNGVDEIRELKNKINLVPSKLKYKVYIIDEVHMLSIGAFNALLKTLEEPPSHVIFILATTEFYKVPQTIVSRCQCIEFKNIDDKSMYDRLLEISNKEKINIDSNAIKEIVRNSNGGMRDAISLLDKVNSYVDSNVITDLDVRDSLGLITKNEINNLINMILNKNDNELLLQIQKYCESGKDLYKILNDIIFELRNIIINQKKYDLIEMIKQMFDYHEKMKQSTNPKILFEIMAIELCQEKNISREIFLEESVRQKVMPENVKSDFSHEKYVNENIVKVRINNTFASASKSELNKSQTMWKTLNKNTFDMIEGSLICDLLDCEVVASSEKNIILCVKYNSLENKINENINKYESVVKNNINMNKKIIAVNKEKWLLLKNEYLDKIKSGYKYEYVNDEDTESFDLNILNLNKENNLISKAENLFGNIVKEEE